MQAYHINLTQKSENFYIKIVTNLLTSLALFSLSLSFFFLTWSLNKITPNSLPALTFYRHIQPKNSAI